MNNGTIVIVVVVVLAVLVLAVIWRYRASNDAKFSIHKLLRFSLKGSNRQEHAEAQHKGVRLNGGARIQAGEVIGGDKITTIISSPQPSAVAKAPRLRLKLFEPGHSGDYHLSIKKAQGAAPHGNRYLIGLALENEEDNAPARGVQMTLSFYWNGEPPNKAIECRYSPQHGEEGWTTRVPQISNDQPAVLVYSQPDLPCLSRHPQEWRGLAIVTRERLAGQIRIHYEVASLQPLSRDQGLLEVDFQ